MRRSHLRQNLVQPLQRPVQMHLDPTRRTSHILSMVFGTPAFNETHPNGAHFSQFVYCFETVVHTLREQLRELGIIEDPQRTTGRNFAHGRRVKSVVMIAITGLHEDGRIGQAFRVNFTVDVIEMDAFTDMAARIFYRRVTIDVAQLTQAETIAIITGIRKAIDNDRRGMAVEDLADSAI